MILFIFLIEQLYEFSHTQLRFVFLFMDVKVVPLVGGKCNCIVTFDNVNFLSTDILNQGS